MSTTSFDITWDYRCPFARFAHQHVVAGLRDGAEWEVRFVPFSLRQMHVEEGDPDVWEEPTSDSGLLALEVAVAVRDHQPDAFLDVHERLFDARHADARDIRERDVLREILVEGGADPDDAFQRVDDGESRKVVQAEHEAAVRDHECWGVPTFIMGDGAVFVRLMEGATDDLAASRSTIERVLDLLTGWPDLNEFKHTSLSR